MFHTFLNLQYIFICKKLVLELIISLQVEFQVVYSSAKSWGFYPYLTTLWREVCLKKSEIWLCSTRWIYLGTTSKVDRVTLDFFSHFCLISFNNHFKYSTTWHVGELSLTTLEFELTWFIINVTYKY